MCVHHPVGLALTLIALQVRSGGGRTSTGGMAGGELSTPLCKVFDSEAEERLLAELHLRKDAKGCDVFEVKMPDGKLLRPYVFIDVGVKNKEWRSRIVTDGGATLQDYAASIGRDAFGKSLEAAAPPQQQVLATPEKGTIGKHSTGSPSDMSIASTAKAASPLDAPAQGDGAPQDEWRRTGNEHIGKDIMRSVLCDKGTGRVTGFSKGKVVGWLPADESDFVSEETGEAAALWHVELEGDLGEEDLEEYELVEAMEVHEQRNGNVDIDDEDYVELIETKSSTDLGKVAKQYNTTARELFLLNSLRIEGLKPSSKLRAKTNLLVPLKQMEEQTLINLACENVPLFLPSRRRPDIYT